MRTIIAPTIAEASSYGFTVLPGQSTSVVSNGLSNSERMTIQIKNSMGQYQNMDNIEAILTATRPQTVISVAGDYKVHKEATDLLSGCCIGELS